MEFSALFSELALLVKPGSVILGLIVVVKFFHHVMDSNRGHKIKQLELLNRCLNEEESGSKEYIVEKLLENTYKVHIPYTQAIAIIEHNQRHELFANYRASKQYVYFDKEKFHLKLKYQNNKSRCIERCRKWFVNVCRYYLSSFFSLMLVLICYKFLWLKGLTEIQFGTYNFVWFFFTLILSLLLGHIAIRSLIDPTSIVKANQFVNMYNEKVIEKKAMWLY